jgi:hypothetical protein
LMVEKLIVSHLTDDVRPMKVKKRVCRGRSYLGLPYLIHGRATVRSGFDRAAADLIGGGGKR